MSIVIDADEDPNATQQFPIGKDWFAGRNLLSNIDLSPLESIFDLNQRSNADDDSGIENHSRTMQVERVHTLSQQLLQKPNRTCLSDAYITMDFTMEDEKKPLHSIVPSQSTLLELALAQPDKNRWGLTFQEDEDILSDNDDGFQSASSTLSEETTSKLAVIPCEESDVWSRALAQIGEKYFTWEQRGNFTYHRTLPFLFDRRIDDRLFQHLCLVLLFNHQPSPLTITLDYRPMAVDEFLRDLCYVLMAIPSETFEWNKSEQTFELKSDVCVLGYSQEIIQTFVRKYIQAGNYFYAINRYINSSHARLASDQYSETESEFSQALRFFLRYIQNSIAVHDITKFSLIQFAAQLDPIICSLDLPLSLISVIEELEQTIRTSSPNTSIAFVKLSSILHTLLNHRHHTIDHNYFLLLIHFITYTLRPLLEFLTRLLIHSNHFDRHNEFPILFTYNRLIGLKTIEFWTKTFTIRYLHANNNNTMFQQILPIELLQQIVNVTRSLMLIRLCDQNHPLCSIKTEIIPELKFSYLNARHEHVREYEEQMNGKIVEYENVKKQKRLEIEQAKVKELMDIYAREDQRRAARQKIIDEEKQRVLKGKQILREQLQQQADEKQRQLTEDKLATAVADAELNKVTSTTTIIGSRLPSAYADLVQSVRDEIISEYDAKMRDASEREEQFRKRTQPNLPVETPRGPPPSSASSSASLSFHTPSIGQSPNIVAENPVIVDTVPPQSSSNEEEQEKLDLMPAAPSIAPPIERAVIRNTVNEETTQAEYRSAVKLVPSNVLRSTIQNYMIDRHPSEDNQKKTDEEQEKIYDWNAIIANGPQFKYDDSFDFRTEEKESQSSTKYKKAASWFDLDMAPLRVWLEQSISPLIHTQTQLVNRALLHYFFDELQLFDHLKNLRAFYFLATGRFGHRFCSEISRLLLSNDDARLIYRINSMHQILSTALDQSGELNNHIDGDILKLTAKTNLPNSLSLLDTTLLDYFDLNYAIQWPLNIVISQEMLDKYQIIFRFLLRILLVKQVLNEIWLMLKVCQRQNSTLSQLHQYRHQMQHFMTVLINYITNQVIQVAWSEFMHKIQTAKHINEIASAHIDYLDRTMLNCLLTPHAAPILNELNRVLTLIIRFRCQLKTFSWILNATYTDVSDTSVQALRGTFEKYHIAVLSLFKVLSKLVEKGYKTSLIDLLVRLNYNGYFDRIASASSTPRRPM